MKLVVALALAITTAGCPAMMKVKEDDLRRKESRAALIAEARAACYPMKREVVMDVVYDVLTERRFPVTSAVRGKISTTWRVEGAQKSTVEAMIDEPRGKECFVVTLAAEVEASPPPKEGINPALPLEDELYLEIYERASALAPPAPPAPPPDSSSSPKRAP
jgi:hypothetical protein